MPNDFSRHNEEVRQVWEAYRNGKPTRVPFGNFTIGPRIWVLNPQLNTEGITWEAMSSDPELMFQTYLKYKYYLVHHIPHDIEMGIPAKAWQVCTEFVNVTEEAWLGNELIYPEGQVSATVSSFSGDRKYQILERGIPDPFSGIFARVKEYHEYFVARAQNYEFHGRPVQVLPPCPLATDGIFTVAQELRGPALLEEMVTDEEYYHALMSLVTEAIIAKIKAWRQYLGLEARPRCGYYADDAIQLLSTKMYIEKVLPYQRRFFQELYGEGPHTIHLCGSVQRHFPTLIKELNIKSFDTGYPIDFTTLRAEIGEEVEIMGGVPVTDLMRNSPSEVYAQTVAILQSGIMQGGKFILKEANNVPPAMPLENLAAMYRAVKDVGVYP